MATRIQRLIAESDFTMSFFLTGAIQKILKDDSFKIFADPLWGSEHQGHREKIHRRAQELSASGHRYVSLSHCAGLGVVSAASSPIGVDVEQTARISEKIVARIANNEETRSAPSSAALWCAKEACFKALKPFSQPSVISQISIGEWQKIDSQFETCRLTNWQSFDAPSENLGVFAQNGLHSFCFFIFRA